jgi:hypothetical protein
VTRQQIERRGFKVIVQGQAFRVVGKGLSILVADLRYIDARDLHPDAQPAPQRHQRDYGPESRREFAAVTAIQGQHVIPRIPKTTMWQERER